MPLSYFIFYLFFKYETIVRSSAWSFGHSDSNPSSVSFKQRHLYKYGIALKKILRNFTCHPSCFGIYESFSLQVIDGAAGGTLARVLSYGGMGTINSNSGLSGTTSKRSSLTRTVTPNHLGLSSLTLSGSVQAEKDKDNSSSGQAENLAQDMHDLMHDFDVVSRISGLIGSLKGQYEVIFPFLGPFLSPI